MLKTITIKAKKREALGKTATKKLRKEGFVPCVFYGGQEHLHFYAPMISFRDLVYTHNAHKVELNIDNKKYQAILQDITFHPVNESITHADFLEISDEKPITIDLPVSVTGSAPGILKGGKLFIKMRKLKVKALPSNLPEHINIDINQLDLGMSVHIKDLDIPGTIFLENPLNAVVSVQIPRLLKLAEEAPVTAETTAAPAEGEQTAEGAAAKPGTVPPAASTTAPAADATKGKEKGKEKGKK